MTDNITLPRAVVEMVRDSLDYARRFNGASVSSEIAALDAALAEPEPEPEPDVADLFARFAAKQKPLDADMAAILHANLDSLYITEDALQEGIDAQDRDLWQRRADEELLKEYEKRYGKPEPATDEQVAAAYKANYDNGWFPLIFFDAWREAERFHGITKEDGK